ncbi:MAG TPA: DUF2269 family protein [Gemmatimonadales bacterium]|nr:DUF2269 family protein [Gemmatimonadales bacterium]
MVELSTWRALHVLGAVLLVGNVTVTGFWAAFLYAQRASLPFRPVARAILWTDLLFTAGGAALLTFSGIQLIIGRGLPFWGTPWLVKGVASLALATALWLAVLIPDQFRLERLAAGEPAGLRRVFLRWSVVGWISTALLLHGLWVMVRK